MYIVCYLLCMKHELITYIVLAWFCKTKFRKDKPEMNPDEVAVVSGQMCIHCHNYFDKGLTICPHCRKRQTNNSFGLTIAIVFGLVFLLFIIAGYFVDKYMINTSNEEEYKTSCKLVSYENLIRVPKDYKNQKI